MHRAALPLRSVRGVELIVYQPTERELLDILLALDNAVMRKLFDGSSDSEIAALSMKREAITADYQRLRLNPRAVLVGRY